MSGDQLITVGDTCIKDLNIRDGIQAYKQARTNKGPLEIVIPRLFHAYALRYQQLNDQKMTKEAEVVLSMSEPCFYSPLTCKTQTVSNPKIPGALPPYLRRLRNS